LGTVVTTLNAQFGIASSGQPNNSAADHIGGYSSALINLRTSKPLHLPDDHQDMLCPEVHVDAFRSERGLLHRN